MKNTHTLAQLLNCKTTRIMQIVNTMLKTLLDTSWIWGIHLEHVGKSFSTTTNAHNDLIYFVCLLNHQIKSSEGRSVRYACYACLNNHLHHNRRLDDDEEEEEKNTSLKIHSILIRKKNEAESFCVIVCILR